jgi:hypothetical protein
MKGQLLFLALAGNSLPWASSGAGEVERLATGGLPQHLQTTTSRGR